MQQVYTLQTYRDMQGNPNHQAFMIDSNEDNDNHNNKKHHSKIYVMLITRKQEKEKKNSQAVQAHYATLSLPIYCQCRASP